MRGAGSGLLFKELFAGVRIGRVCKAVDETSEQLAAKG